MFDYNKYLNELLALKNTDEKIEWRNSIVKTNLTMLSINQKDLKDISKSIIKQNNIEEFLINDNFTYYEETLIYGNVISTIKDINIYEKYLYKLLKKTDNWATCDNLRFNTLYKVSKKDLFNLSLKLLDEEFEFYKRVGILILFKFINDSKYEDKIYNLLNSLYNENMYYVNMAASWLLCEMFIKNKNKTIEYYKNHSTNKFIINKSISKCRDSFRVSDSDKDFLLKFKVI